MAWRAGAVCSLSLTAKLWFYSYFRFFLSAVVALRLRICRNFLAYFKDKLIDHLSALKVQLGKWLLVTVFARYELSARHPFKNTGTERCSRKSRSLLPWLFWL
jgi:hypothetical protein